MTPSNENETRLLLSTAYKHRGPAAVRYPRGTGPNSSIDRTLDTVELGKAKLIREGNSDIVFLNFGALLHEAEIVSEKMDMTLIDMRFVKPLDEEILSKHLKNASMLYLWKMAQYLVEREAQFKNFVEEII